MQPRMTSPALMIPEALQALLALGEAALKGGVSPKTHHLMHLRASQINGCGFCADMHGRDPALTQCDQLACCHELAGGGRLPQGRDRRSIFGPADILGQ